MNILQIEDFFHPDTGYQITILSKYLRKFGHQVTIVTAEMDKMPDYLTSFFGKDNIEERDRAYEEQYGVKIVRLPLKRYISGRAIYKESLVQVVRSFQPELLFVHGNDTASAMTLLWSHKKLGCPLISDNHMCLMASRNPLAGLFRRFYRMVFTPIIKKDHLYVVSTGEDRYAVNQLGVPLGQSPLISFGSDLMLFHPDGQVKSEFRKQNGIAEDAFVVLYAGKMDEAKGGQLLADLICEHLQTQREVVYVVIGNTVGEYGAKLEARLRESPYRVLRFPTQKYCDLASFFQGADLALIPKQCSLSLFDFNAAGLPVLAEDNVINIERCGHGNGWTFHEGDLLDFKRKLEQILSMPQEEFNKVSETATAFITKEYNYEDKAREFEKLFFETMAHYRLHSSRR